MKAIPPCPITTIPDKEENIVQSSQRKRKLQDAKQSSLVFAFVACSSWLYTFPLQGQTSRYAVLGDERFGRFFSLYFGTVLLLLLHKDVAREPWC